MHIKKLKQVLKEEKTLNYLDTDIILALIKDDDWLKNYVSISNLRPACTSVFTIVEARIVLEREYSKEKALEALDKIKELKISLIEFDEKILKKSQELLTDYTNLNNFDAIHVSFALVNDLVIIGTDKVFAKISGLKRKDPREI
jgi:predicted nucleic acid-binding protein